MNKRITDIISDVEVEKVFYEVGEEEIPEEISIERIKSRVNRHIDQANEQSEVVMHPIVNLPKKKRVNKKLLALVAVLVITATTIVASQYNKYFGSLYDDQYHLIHEQIQYEQKRSIAGGIICSVGGIVVDNQSGLLVITFEKEDGTPFERELSLDDVKGFKIDILGRASGGKSYRTSLSEDKTEFSIITELSSSVNLNDTGVIVNADALGRWETTMIPIDINLYEVYRNTTLDCRSDSKSKYDINNALQIPIAKDVMLDGVGFEDGELRIVSTVPVPLEETDKFGFITNLDIEYELSDRRTGTIIGRYGRSGGYQFDNGLNLYNHRFEGISKEDLEYMDVVLVYKVFVAEYEGPWELAFNLGSNENIKTSTTNKTFMIDGIVLGVDQVEVSALGARIEGDLKEDMLCLDIYIQLKDGSQQVLEKSTYMWEEGEYVLHLKPVNRPTMDEEELKLLKLNHNKNIIQAERSGNTVISKSTSITMEETTDVLIDVEEVEAIVIQGEVIYLQ